ncbi:hypothetical protein PTKIN_Ptkin16aG0094400 [Pterospermum kingtungense]
MSNGDRFGDIIIEILLKLPVKSITRFKPVAKTWNQLLQNPSFVFQHFSNSRKNKRRLLVHNYYYDNEHRVNVMRLFADEALVSYHDLHQQLHSPFAALNDFHDFHYCYWVEDGLFCLLNEVKCRIALWKSSHKKI